MTFRFSQRSRNNLEGVHPDLVRVVERALELTRVDFVVIEGLRTKERQRKLFAARATRTMNSRHLTGHAVDLVPWIDGTIRWDWPPFYKIAEAMKEAAEELGVALTWGGSWTHFKDGPHFELDRKVYPA
jgi:peptidoglycan L-alanyl-D-glutamate endopeptidase CwlK